MCEDDARIRVRRMHSGDNLMGWHLLPAADGSHGNCHHTIDDTLQ